MEQRERTGGSEDVVALSGSQIRGLINQVDRAIAEVRARGQGPLSILTTLPHGGRFNVDQDVQALIILRDAWEAVLDPSKLEGSIPLKSGGSVQLEVK